MQRLGIVAACCAGVASLIGGCNSSSGSEPGGVAASQLALMSVANQNADVASMRFDVERVACEEGEEFEAYNKTVDAELLPQMLTAGVLDGFASANDSAHPFADHFFVLPAGCYDVQATPLNESGEPSEECTPSSKPGVAVEDGQTTEIILVSQCEGDERGALDVLGTLNYAPTILDLTFEPSKFVDACVPGQVCVTVQDPDTDGIEVAWEVLEGEAFAGPEVVSHSMNDDGTVTECIEVTFENSDSYPVKVSVFDTITVDGEEVRVEDYLAGTEHAAPSHDELTFPMHVLQSDAVCEGDGNGNGGGDADGFLTYTQGGWGAPPSGNNPGAYLVANFDQISDQGVVTIGCGEGFTIEMQSAQAITDFLPAGGQPAALDQSYVNPTETGAGVLAGQVLAARLNIAADQADADFAPAEDNLADLVATTGFCEGATVAEIVEAGEDVLGTCREDIGPSDINECLDAVNNAFNDGNASGYLERP